MTTTDLTNLRIEVAEKMGWTDLPERMARYKARARSDSMDFWQYIDCPNYVDCHNTAMTLVDALREEGWTFECGNLYEGLWEVWFNLCAGIGREPLTHYVSDASLCVAICRAFLAVRA